MHVRRPKGVAYTALGVEPLRCGVWGEPQRAGMSICLGVGQSAVDNRQSEMHTMPAAGSGWLTRAIGQTCQMGGALAERPSLCAGYLCPSVV